MKYMFREEDIFTYCFTTRFLTPSIANLDALLTKFENILNKYLINLN